MANPSITADNPSFSVDARAEGDGFRIDVIADRRAQSYIVPTATQQDFSAFFRELANDFGTRVPHVFAETVEHPAPPRRLRPLLTENVHPQILVGYGDPAVLRTEDGWWLVATSNDAPDAFPILHSNDLTHWESRGFVFAQGREPEWTAKGRNVADFWAPEIARVGEEYWLCFTARQVSNALAIGLARAASPEGPGVDNGPPLITGKPTDPTGLRLDPTTPPPLAPPLHSHLLPHSN